MRTVSVIALTLNTIAQASQPDISAATQPTTAPHDDALPGSEIATEIVEMLGPTFTETSLYGYLVLMLGLVGGLAAARIVKTILRNVSDRLKQRGWPVRAAVFQHASGPASLALFSLGLAIGFQGLFLTEQIRPLALKLIGLLYIVAIGWFLYNLVDLIDFALRRVTAKSATRLDDTVVTLLRKALRIFLLIMLALFIAQNFFGANITAWLAGLGIAGLAVSLAAQDSVKNLFGSLTVLIERPFGLGDRIIFDGFDGTVEQIGFRSSKVRLLTGHLLTVPNMRFTDGAIENITARPHISRTMNLPLAYDTPPEKVEHAVGIIKRILAEQDILEPINSPDRQPRVFFNEFGQAGLNIMITYAYGINHNGRDWWSYQAHGEMLNFRILRAFAQDGIELAFPTQTMYLASDPKRQLSVKLVQDNASHG